MHTRSCRVFRDCRFGPGFSVGGPKEWRSDARRLRLACAGAFRHQATPSRVPRFRRNRHRSCRSYVLLAGGDWLGGFSDPACTGDF